MSVALVCDTTPGLPAAESRDDALRLVEQGTEIRGGPPRFCTQVGPVLGAHLGSGLLVGGLTNSVASTPRMAVRHDSTSSLSSVPLFVYGYATYSAWRFR